MKFKYALSIVALAVATSASAIDVGVSATVDGKENAQTITFSQANGKWTPFTALTHQKDQNKFTVGTSYELAKLGQLSVGPKVGVSYLNNTAGAVDGYALSVGPSLSYPVARGVALTADVARQYGQSRVNQFDGTRTSVGLKVSF